MSTTFGKRLGMLMARRGLKPGTLDARLEALGLRSRNFTHRASELGKQDVVAEVFTHLADWLGTTVEFLVAGRGPADAGEAASTPAVPAIPEGLEEQERTILALARHMGHKAAIDRLVLCRVEPPGPEPRQTGEALPPPSAASRNGRAGGDGN